MTNYKPENQQIRLNIQTAEEILWLKEKRLTDEIWHKFGHNNQYQKILPNKMDFETHNVGIGLETFQRFEGNRKSQFVNP